MSPSQSFAPNMPFKFAPRLRACGAIASLLLGAALMAAEGTSPFIGLTRDQVLAKLGQPKSNIAAGDREVLFFTRERLVLRNNVVVEAEDIPVEPPPPPAAPAAATTDTASAPAAPVATTTEPPKAPGAEASGAAVAEPAGKATTSVVPVQTAPRPAEVQIISVRPPSKSGVSTAPATPPPAVTRAASAPVTTVPPAAVPVVPAAPQPSPAAAVPARPEPKVAASPTAKPSVPPVPAPVAGTTSTAAPLPSETSAPAPAPATPAATASATPTTNTATEANAAPTTGAALTTPAADAAPAVPPSVASTPKAGPKPAPKREAAQLVIPDVTESIFSLQTYAISLVIIATGIGYLMWRRRERQLALSASAVSNSPFVTQTAAAAPAAARFTGELLAKLEWKRFEELVASYYNKTGVVASRTKSGPASPVHIRISWKGEPRPFACVQCISHPTELIDAKPIQALCDAIAAEDIRRGYAVTSGKFSVPARDLAEEKHITLLSGDIFLEKLNALPEPARAELMRDATSGDYMTPTCPQCDLKVARSASDPSVWQCPQCGTVLPRA
jgi:hypothetical protein